jgi:tRNA threonylcarbamoyladenosine biosynthesis protein TsaB
VLEPPPGMRVLGIETSSRRGSVALWENGRLVASLAHEQPHAHAERMLPLVNSVLAEAGWGRGSLDRVAAGIGPGSFTGLRVGLALAQGLALGLGRPLVGVPSLRSMARAVPRTVPGARCAVIDARRGEVFCALYGAEGAELGTAVAWPRESALARIAELVSGAEVVLVGEAAAELGGRTVFRSPESDLPHAHWTAQIGAEVDVTGAPATPLYVREPDAIKPDLPPSPLADPEKN